MTDNFAAQEVTMTVIILYQRKSPSDCHLFPAEMRNLSSHEVKNDSEAGTVVTRRLITKG